MAFSAFTHYLCLSSLLVSVVSANDDTVGFVNTSMTVPENIGQVTFCIKFYRKIQHLVKGRVFTTNPKRDDSVTSVGNFSSLYSATALIPIDCLNASVLDNSIVEFGKVYYMNITADPGPVTVRELANQMEIIITDDDTVTIGFSKTSVTVSESDGYATVCMNRVGEARNLGGGQVPQGALSVRLSTFPGTATSNGDFTPRNYTLVDFGLSEMSKCVNVPINNDDVIEEMETFYVTMTNGSSLVIVNETRNNLTVNIRNDDKVTAQFEEAYNKEVEENFEEGEIELGCVIDRESQIPIQIRFDTDNFTSTAIVGSDFTIENKILTFPPGTTNVTLKIKIIRDGEAESPEILVLRMVSLDDNLVKIGKNDTAKIKINDKVDNENEAARQKEIENERRSEIYILLIVAIVLIAFLFICGIIFCICFIKSKNN